MPAYWATAFISSASIFAEQSSRDVAVRDMFFMPSRTAVDCRDDIDILMAFWLYQAFSAAIRQNALITAVDDCFDG